MSVLTILPQLRKQILIRQQARSTGRIVQAIPEALTIVKIF